MNLRALGWCPSGLLVAALALLSGCYETGENYGGETHFLTPCEKTTDCSGRAACVEGFCEPVEEASGGAMVETEAPEPAPVAQPLVMLLVDTSGSSERRSECVCDDLACMNCLPDCERGERNRFTQTLEALTGTFEDFSCEAVDRELELPAGAFDTGYYLPYHRPSGRQLADGVLDLYADRLRFGVATFDGMETYSGGDRLTPMDAFKEWLSGLEAGMWSYSPERERAQVGANLVWRTGSFRYPNCTTDYFMDTGIRNSAASNGALQVAIDPATAVEVNAAIQASLLQVRPFGGTPIAAALDDLYYLFAGDYTMADERERRAPLHVVLITDGEPDKDYREDLHCDCNVGDDPERCGPSVTNDPELMHCPYPLPVLAARKLACGSDPLQCAAPMGKLHVIGLDVGTDETIVDILDDLAEAGRSDHARLAANGADLRRELEDLFDEIARER